ncbi:hypothetical protein CsSME_00052329 [Camellia sinensis var. sinensis]
MERGTVRLRAMVVMVMVIVVSGMGVVEGQSPTPFMDCYVGCFIFASRTVSSPRRLKVSMVIRLTTSFASLVVLLRCAPTSVLNKTLVERKWKAV